MLLAAAQGPGNYSWYMGDKDALNLPLDLFNRFACLLSCVPTPPPPKWPALHSPLLLQRHSELVFGTLCLLARWKTCCGDVCLESKWVVCNLCALALGLALHIFATPVVILLYRFLSCLTSQNVLNVLSALQFIVFRPTSGRPSVWSGRSSRNVLLEISFEYKVKISSQESDQSDHLFYFFT